MFEKFLSVFLPDKRKDQLRSLPIQLDIGVSGLGEFLQKFSGQSFNNGLYRVHSSNELDKWNKIVSEGFPDFEDRIICFAYDWLGRHFALDKERIGGGEPLVLMLEPGTGEALEIPVTLLDFHNKELVEYTDEALAYKFFTSWLDRGNSPPSYSECIGYIKPLFLGGVDTVDNLDRIDLEVYWGISAQLIEKVRELAPGTPVNGISIN